MRPPPFGTVLVGVGVMDVMGLALDHLLLRAAFQAVHTARVAAFGDFDNAGDIDIALVNMDGLLELLENRAGRDRHWLGVRALDVHGRNALGAMVSIVSGEGTKTRQVLAAYSYASSNDPRVLFGLGDSATVNGVTIKWPGGETEHFGPQRADRYVELVQGRGRSAFRDATVTPK